MLAFLGGLFSALFSNGVAYFVAIKVVMATLVITVLPIVLTNWFKSIIDGMLALVSGYAGTVSPLALSFGGLTGWALANMQIPACFAIIFSAIAFKVSLKLIPFVRL